MEALCLWKNLCSWKNQKRKEVLGKKERKRKQAHRRKKEYHSVKKRKIFLCESDWCWPSSMLASRFRLKKSPSNKNLPNTLFKTRFPFLYVSTGLDTKTWTITSNRNFESSISIRCLAPQHLFRFFHLCRGFFLCLWQLCSLFCPPPQLSTERWGKKKKSVCNGLLFPRNLDPSLIPGDPVVLLVCGFRRRVISWHGTSCLRTFMS